MDIIFDEHTIIRAQERGTNENEILEVLRSGNETPAKYGRLSKYKIFQFDSERFGKFYRHKKVQVFYTIEKGTLITVTVYVFFGKWEI